MRALAITAKVERVCRADRLRVTPSGPTFSAKIEVPIRSTPIVPQGAEWAYPTVTSDVVGSCWFHRALLKPKTNAVNPYIENAALGWSVHWSLKRTPR